MPCFFARLLIVSPAACPRRSCSNSSTLPLLSIPECFHPGLPVWAKSDDQCGQMRVSNSRPCQGLSAVAVVWERLPAHRGSLVGDCALCARIESCRISSGLLETTPIAERLRQRPLTSQ